MQFGCSSSCNVAWPTISVGGRCRTVAEFNKCVVGHFVPHQTGVNSFGVSLLMPEINPNTYLRVSYRYVLLAMRQLRSVVSVLLAAA